MEATNYTAQQFAKTVTNDLFMRKNAATLFEAARSDRLQFSHKTAQLAAQGLGTAQMGHPDFDDLAIGERRSAEVACVFMDLTDFTGRSFWDSPGEVTDLAHAVLTGFAEAVQRFGGHALGLRGDGIFAAFGPAQPAPAATFALAACAFAIDAVQREVNPWLAARHIEPVKVRAGLDYGRIDFVRTGSAENSEINPSGFAANFAAKCEKYASPWEIVVGAGLTAHLANKNDFTAHNRSPKTFTRNYQTRTYSYYQYDWRPILKHLPGAIAQLNGRPISALNSQ